VSYSLLERGGRVSNGGSRLTRRTDQGSRSMGDRSWPLTGSDSRSTVSPPLAPRGTPCTYPFSNDVRGGQGSDRVHGRMGIGITKRSLYPVLKFRRIRRWVRLGLSNRQSPHRHMLTRGKTTLTPTHRESVFQVKRSSDHVRYARPGTPQGAVYRPERPGGRHVLGTLGG
jgi:hypothetical protein